MQEFKFNYCIPREYKDKETGEIKYAICRGGEKMNIDTLKQIQKYTDKELPKNAAPWCQVFNNGYRVTKDTLNYKEWTGITFSDIDSKYFYKYNKPFDVDKLLKAIINEAPYKYEYNYYACHLTNSKQSFRIFWYWNCEKTEDNFKKCCLLSEQYARQLFYSFGEQAKQIIDYKIDNHNVLDHCSTSVMQGFYITTNKIYYSDFINNKDFGYCNLEDISLEQIYETQDVIKTNGNYNQHNDVCFNNKIEVNSNEIKYYPHHHRRCIYEALIVLFEDKEKVDKEWKYIANLIPETDGIEGGHKHSFYEKEPEKNRWYERFDNNTIHKLDWLKSFGYEYTDKSEYIYYRQFRSSWKKHIKNKVILIYLKTKYPDDYKEWEKNGFKIKDENDYSKDFIKEKQEINSHSIFEPCFNCIEEDIIDLYRCEYYKTRWKPEDFKYLCNGYDIPKDIVTYKMYADFYYRDKNNLPIIKYDILEDEIKILGYWPESNKIQWHPFKYGNEYTHWKNNDTFCNSCNKSDILEALNKYTPRWHNYHSIKEYLNSLDLSTANEELLETWAIRYFKSEDTKLTREICKKFFIAAVKKQMVEDPTTFVFQHMLFLQGETGCGKTFFLVTMFTINGHSYILNKIDPNGKDSEIGPLIAKNWLIQFGESESLKKISVNAAKEFVDRINLGMKYQKKYENEQTTIYPRILACRTSNDDTLFNDISISKGDRRNWLIICKTPINSCDDELRTLIENEKDILWATAYKLYLDNPEQNLELSNEAFNELSELQEDYKLVKNSDIEELYNEIFERYYMTNEKHEIQDEYSFKKMLERNDDILEEDTFITEFLDKSTYRFKSKIEKIPAKWISNYIKFKYNNNYMKLLKDYLIEHGWYNTTSRYLNSPYKCWIKE